MFINKKMQRIENIKKDRNTVKNVEQIMEDQNCWEISSNEILEEIQNDEKNKNNAGENKLLMKGNMKLKKRIKIEKVKINK